MDPGVKFILIILELLKMCFFFLQNLQWRVILLHNGDPELLYAQLRLKFSTELASNLQLWKTLSWEIKDKKTLPII